MELKLNIYNELDEVVKTHRRQSYSLKMRQLKRIINTFELDKLAKVLKGKDKEANAGLIEVVSNFVLKSYEQVQELMMDVFPDMTEEEYLETHVNEVAEVVISLGKYAFKVIGIAGNGSKN